MKRHLSLISVLALVLAACGGTTADSTSTSQAEAVTTSTTVPAVDAVLLSYTLAAGDEYQYEVGLDQHIEMSASGDASMMGEEDVPGDASLDVAGTATFTHVVSEGPEPGTFEVHITGEFADVSMSGIVDGEEVDSEDAPEFAAIEPIDVTVVVDEQGNLVQEGPAGAEDPLSGMLGGLGALGGGGAPAPGLDPGQFVGPPFSDEEVTVGDTWTDEIETPGLGEDPVVTTITSAVAAIEELDGTEVYVIESNSATSLIEFDLGQFFAGMFGAFGEEATPEETAELEAMLEQLKFLMTIDGSTADSRTWFDAAAGVARQSETTASTNIKMDMNLPDEATGEMTGFVLDMKLDQDVSYRLISGPAA